jgi:hypothetical protein
MGSETGKRARLRRIPRLMRAFSKRWKPSRPASRFRFQILESAPQNGRRQRLFPRLLGPGDR